MKIQLTTPSRGQLDHEYLQSVDEFIALCRELKGTPEEFELRIVRMYGCSLLDHARSRLASNFMVDGFDLLLWVDDDMVFDAHETLALCREALERKTIVGAVCSTRGQLGKMTAKFGDHVEKVGFFSQGDIHECISVGTGLTAVHRDVFQKLIESGEVPECNTAGNGGEESIWPFYMTVVEDGCWWGEDTSFCIRARRAGFTVFVDTRARVGHKGSYVYHIEDTASKVTLYRGMNAAIVQPNPEV